ncbi:hypothetical protein BG015_005621, partial [Linnemannia schmuckeri]
PTRTSADKMPPTTRTHSMTKDPPKQPYDTGDSDGFNNAQHVGKDDKTKVIDAVTTNHAVNTDGAPQAAGWPTTFPANNIHPVNSQAIASFPSVEKPFLKARKFSNVFLKNLPAPIMKTALPSIQDRVEISQQLAYCSALLLRGSFSPQTTATKLQEQAHDPAMALQKSSSLDKKELDWLAEMDKNPPAQDRIRWLGARMVDEFAKNVLKDSTEIAEMVLLGPVLDKETFRRLLSCILTAFEQSVHLSVDLLQGIVQLVQVAPPQSLVSDDLVKIMLLDVMAEHKVQDLNRVEDHKLFADVLSGLKGSSDPYLMYQACYAFQAL